MPFLRRALLLLITASCFIGAAAPVFAQGEVDIKIPDLDSVTFVGGLTGSHLLMGGLIVSGLGFLFGLIIYSRLKNMPVHSSMKEISELIYETCKTYLLTQGRFLLILEIFIGAAMIF